MRAPVLSGFRSSLRYSAYSLKKIQENNEAEIMEVVADEARSSYPAEIVVELTSESTEDLEKNVTRIVQWINAWREQQKQKQDGE